MTGKALFTCKSIPVFAKFLLYLKKPGLVDEASR
jgi:hypothetical protein